MLNRRDDRNPEQDPDHPEYTTPRGHGWDIVVFWVGVIILCVALWIWFFRHLF